MYYAKEKDFYKMQEEIGAKEGELIRRFMPRLNTQIPNEKNWRKFIQKKIDN